MSSNGKNGANGKEKNSHADRHTPPRWAGITRPYSYDDVLRLRGTVQIEYTLARLGAERLWNLMHSDAYVPALGAITGNQAIEMVQAGLKAIYGSGWQVAADGNTAGDVYPDQSLYPCDSAPNLVKRLNRALLRADQIESAERKPSGNRAERIGLRRS
jgi:isocitrate lyase